MIRPTQSSLILCSYLKKLLSYNPDTGLFVWKVSKARRIKIGDIAGGLNLGGYIQIRIDGNRYYAHRLAWLYIHGCYSENEIDHLNGNRSDNRIINLRDITHDLNVQNQRSARLDNKLGILGVCLIKGKYRAEIRVKGKKQYLGYFDTTKEAHEAYLVAKRKYHEGCTI